MVAEGLAAEVLLRTARHGQSDWNAMDVITGWIDVGLSEHGRRQAQRAGVILATRGFFPDVVHPSVQRRAIVTADLALAGCGRSWVPVRRSWRLNSNHYGALQGRGKAEVRAEAGEEQFTAWRCVLVVSHGNTLLALLKHLQGVSDDASSGLEIPNAVPVCYGFEAGACRPADVANRPPPGQGEIEGSHSA